jgi:hypothetical protein
MPPTRRRSPRRKPAATRTRAKTTAPDMAPLLTAAEMAHMLRCIGLSTLLHETLDEERRTDARLTEIQALEIHPRAFIWHAAS